MNRKKLHRILNGMGGVFILFSILSLIFIDINDFPTNEMFYKIVKLILVILMLVNIYLVVSSKDR